MSLTAQQKGGKDGWWKRLRKKFNWLGFLAALLALIAGGFFVWGICMWWPLRNDPPENVGNIGDFMGGTAGTLGSLAALFYLIRSVLLQNQDLKQQRKNAKRDRKNQKEDLKLQRKQLERSQHIHQFDQHLNMIYDSLRALRSEVMNMAYKKGKKTFKRRDCFRAYCESLRKEFKALEIKCEMKKVPNSEEYAICPKEAKRIINVLFTSNDSLTYYFSVLQNLVENIFRFRSLEEKRLYSSDQKGQKEQEDLLLEVKERQGTYYFYVQSVESEVSDYAKLLLVMYSLVVAESGIEKYLAKDFYSKMQKPFNGFFSNTSDCNMPLNVNVFDFISENDAIPQVSGGESH